MISSEQKYLANTLAQLDQLKGYLNEHTLDVATAKPKDWYDHFFAINQVEKNSGPWLNFAACMMARDYLVSALQVEPYDVFAASQAGPGWDIDARTKCGKRVIGEIRTTMPSEHHFQKLSDETVDHKYFFLFGFRTFEKTVHQFQNSYPKIAVVLLPERLSMEVIE